MSQPFKLKYKNSAFPFKAEPTGPGAFVVNQIARDRKRKVEKATGNPEKWTQNDKDANQKALNTIRQVRQSYPIPDSSNKKGEYKEKGRPDLSNSYYFGD